MIKKSSLLILIILAALLLIAAVLFVLSITILKKIPTISDCKNLECVKSYVAVENFNPEDCAKAAENLRDNCYYAYEIKKTPNGKNDLETGKYCLLVGGKNLEADCLFKTVGAIMNPPSNVKDNLIKSIKSLNTEPCNNMEVLQWKEQCLNDIAGIKKAVEEKDITYCFPINTGDNASKISSYGRKVCIDLFPQFFPKGEFLKSLLNK